MGAPCPIPLTGNVGVPLMATLNLPGFTLGLLVWLFSTPIVLNALDASQVSTLYQGHKNTVSPSPVLVLLLLLPHAVKVLILVTDSLKRVKEGGIGRGNIRKGAPVQPLQVKLNLTTQSLQFMLGAPIQPLQVILDLSTQPLQVKLIFTIQPLLIMLVGSFQPFQVTCDLVT